MIFPLKELNDHIQSLYQKEGLISIWGEFGVGKTTFTLQTALYNCVLSNLVIFVYTKSNLPLKLLKRISQKFNQKNMNNFLLYKILNFSELFDFTLDLGKIITNLRMNRNRAKLLIIIDSITNLYQIELRKNNKSKNVILNYKLNQILATLRYLKLQYPIDVLLVNYVRRVKQETQTIGVQSGGKVMPYWLECSIKIERDKKINYRNFLLYTHSDTKKISIPLKLTEYGFERI